MALQIKLLHIGLSKAKLLRLAMAITQFWNNSRDPKNAHVCYQGPPNFGLDKWAVIVLLKSFFIE